VLGELHITAANMMAPLFHLHTTFTRPEWLPKISFTWFAMIGALVVFCIGVLFPTPPSTLEAAQRRAEEALPVRAPSRFRRRRRARRALG